jgi:putative transposase
MRESVLVRYDPTDIAQVFIFHNNKFVCIATCAELTGKKVSYQDVQKARTARVKSLRSTITSAQELVQSYAKQSARIIPDSVPDNLNMDTTPRSRFTIRRYSVDE